MTKTAIFLVTGVLCVLPVLALACVSLRRALAGDDRALQSLLAAEREARSRCEQALAESEHAGTVRAPDGWQVDREHGAEPAALA